MGLFDLNMPAPSLASIQHAQRKQIKQARVKTAFVLSALFVLTLAASMLAINRFQFIKNVLAGDSYNYTMVFHVALLLLLMVSAIVSFFLFVNDIIDLFDDSSSFGYAIASAESIDKLADLNLPDFAKDYIRSILDQGRTPTILECKILNDCAAQWTARLATAKSSRL